MLLTQYNSTCQTTALSPPGVGQIIPLVSIKLQAMLMLNGCLRCVSHLFVAICTVTFKQECSLDKTLTCVTEIWFWLLISFWATHSKMFSPCCETWISTKESGNYSYEIDKWSLRETQNLKMKELVSTAAVSFRHARAQVFLFWPFLSIFTWIRLMMN